MKKIISIILTLAMVLSITVTAFAKEETITLTDFLGIDKSEVTVIRLFENNYEIQVTISDPNMIEKFFQITDNVNLVKQEDVKCSELLNGLYIEVATDKSLKTGIAYISGEGYADKYSVAMSRLPAKAYKLENSDSAATLIADICSLSDSITLSDWAKEDVLSIQKLGFCSFSDYTTPATRLEFCQMLYKMMCATPNKIVTEQTPKGLFTDCNSVEAEYFSELGIMKGTGENKFSPNEMITREEVAAIVYRLARNQELKGFYDDYRLSSYMFIDQNEMSDWAIEAISQLKTIGLMDGVGNDMFAPTEVITREQAVVIATRLFNRIPKNNNSQVELFADKVNAQMPKNKNYMFSPLSIKMALALAANGANGETKNEILNAVNVKDLDTFNTFSKEMIEKYSKTDVLKLNIANSIWINKSETSQSFLNTYKNKIAQFYNGETGITDNDNAVKTINDWVNDKTNKKIPTIINDNDFWAMLINAIYFKGAWQSEFNKGVTAKAEFTDRNNEKSEMDFMNKTTWMNYCNSDGVQIVQLPYKNRVDNFDKNGEYLGTDKYDDIDVSMFIMMSDKTIQPETVLKASSLENKFVALSMPKFKIEYETELNDIFKTLGINKAFEENAEFTNMFDKGNMWITDSIHKTYITVDEKGTEAAAVTAISMAGSSLPPEPVDFKANKPFTFVIRDNINGEILFMGEYAYAK